MTAPPIFILFQVRLRRAFQGIRRRVCPNTNTRPMKYRLEVEDNGEDNDE